VRLGIFAKTFAGTAPGVVFEAVRRAGYECVQYNMACSGLSPLPLAIPDEVADEVRAAAEENGIAIEAVSATYNILHPDAGERERGRRAFVAIAAAARRMGAKLLTVCTGTRDAHDMWRYHPENASEESWAEMCREFRRLLAVAEEHNVFVGVEPELGNVVSSARQARKLIEEMEEGRVRIVFDAANLFEAADAARQHAFVDEAVDLLGGWIAIAHAKDRLPDGRFGTAGDGVLDYPYFLRALKRHGFEGSLITHGLSEADAGRVAAFLRKRIAAVEAGA
jgi:sugar phosphate isomerase/epimerase